MTLPGWRDGCHSVAITARPTVCAVVSLASNVTSGGGDGVDTPGAFGGQANTTLSQGNLPNVTFAGSVNIPAGQGSHAHNFTAVEPGGGPIPGGGSGFSNQANGTALALLPGMSGTASVNSGGSGTAFANLGPFKLNTYYMKL